MSVQTQIARIENAKTAIKTAIEGKGVTVQADTKLDGMAALINSIKAGGGGEVLNFFGGSKFYTCTITPLSDAESITITPDDASILDSLKFLLIVPDIPGTSAQSTQRASIKAPMRGPSMPPYISARMAFLTGLYSISMNSNSLPWGVSSESGEVACKFEQTTENIVADRGITIDSSKGKITISSYVNSYMSMLFHGGSTYKVLLIG